MKLIIGLGNPGEKYQKTRHNVGFMIIDEIQKKLEFPTFEFNKKFNALISEKNFPLSKGNQGFFKNIFQTTSQEKIILVKPQTFMNLSGQTVRTMLDFYKLHPRDITVINDDLDIIIGNYKISHNSSAHGHNGIQNIIDNLSTPEFKRFKIGIEQELGRASRQIPGESFVLADFSSAELAKITTLTEKIIPEIF